MADSGSPLHPAEEGGEVIEASRGRRWEIWRVVGETVQWRLGSLWARACLCLSGHVLLFSTTSSSKHWESAHCISPQRLPGGPETQEREQMSVWRLRHELPLSPQ